MSGNFVHLHTHSEYSLLDGLGRIKNLVSEAKKLGQPALALTDHGVMHGAVEFFRAAKSAEIKPIIGVESYQTVWGRPMGGRDSQFDRENYHLLLLAKNMTGYRNLLKICSNSHLNGYYYRPRVDHEFLAAHAEGIIATTGCLGAEVPQLVMQGKEQEAYERLGWYVDVFGKENFFIELQEHSIPELIPVNKVLVPWADKFGIQLVATNDVHYVREQDGGPHDVLLCVQTGTTVHATDRMRMSDGSYFLKSRAQMEETFRPLIDLPASAFDNSVLIAEMCDVDLEDDSYHLPDLPIPEGFTYESYLRHLTEEGLERLYGETAKSDVVQERKERELSIIHQMGFDIYFLIVADLCNFARTRNIWWNVRGSGAGSLVAYCVGITGIDPLKNNLIFERFLNPGRVSMPDFDLDFPDDQREEMIRYTLEKFGEDQVAQIATFGRMKARAAVRDVGRAKAIDLSQVDRIAKLIPAIPGKPVTIQDVLTEGHEFYSPDLVQLYQNEPWARDLLDTSMQVEGVARHSSVHAAAVIVADRELSHYTPLMRGNKNTITSTITQYEFPILESIGLLKVDFLGLSTLSVMREAARLIRERHGIEYTLSTIPIEGEETVEAFKLLSSGEVSGVFQVEGQGMRRVLTEMRPTTFEHIVATISLYRPGPLEYIPSFIRRMHGEEEVEYKHPSLENILGETYGICVSGDSVVMDVRTGERRRLDQVNELDEFHIQGVDANWQPAIGRVTHWIDSGYKEVYKVTLRNGASIKVTGDHRLLIETGWQPLNKLVVGDHIGTPPLLLGPDDDKCATVDQRKLRVLAYLLADGSLGNLAAIDFVSKEPALLDEYIRCLEAFPDVRPVFTPQVRGVTRISVAKQEDLGAHYHTPTSLLAWLRELRLKHPAGSRPGGLRSHEKFVPSFVFNLSKRDIAFFLASLWDGDGYIGRRLCHYRTISKQLAEDVQTLLLRLGIRSTIYTAPYPNQQDSETEQRSSYQLTIYDTARLAAELQPYMCSAKRNRNCTGYSHPTIARNAFLEEVKTVTTLSSRALMQEYGIDRQHFYPKGVQRQRISTHVVEALTAALPMPSTARKLNVDWQEIVAIEPAGVEHVYDLTVEGLHSFVANNIIVHNCVYQEQIIQILSQLAGYTPGDADLVRRAISKKKASDIEKHKKIFVEGCYQNGIPKDAAAAIYGDIEFFARYGFNKCLPGDVEVIDAATGRLVKIEDLYLGNAQIDQTITCDTDALRLQAGAVTAVMDNGIKPVYRLTTALGRTLEATANHPFYAFEGWRMLEELRVGDQIAVPRTLPVEGKSVWPDREVIVLGHLLAEGNLCHPHSVYYYSKDPVQCEDYVQAVEQFDNVAASISLHKGTYSIYARRRQRSQAPAVMAWAEALGLLGKTAHTKEIPAAAFELNNRQVALLISRMWEGDGHINVTGRSLFYATASARMARQLQHLLLRLGIISSLRTVEFPYEEGRTGYQLFITGQANLAVFASHIGAHFVSEQRRAKLAALCAGDAVDQRLNVKDVVPLGIKKVVRANKEAQGITWDALNQACGVAQREFYPTNAATKQGFARQTIQRLADYFANDELRRYATSDIYWDRIVSIEYMGEKQTYDLEIADTHNFIANDILVHNSHAADYGVITVQTAFLKANYPVEYMAALLLIERDKTEKVINFINECRRMGIDVLPPDVNYSGLDFEIQTRPADTESNSRRDPNLAYQFPVPEGSAIRFGMAAVKNVGEGPVKVILAAREEGGPFQSLEDFCERVDLRQVNKRALECLIKVGALDRFGNRNQLLNVLDQMVAQSASVFSARDSGQLSMFDLMSEGGATSVSPIRLPDLEEVKGREKLVWEKELLGVYAMSHPLQVLSVDIRNIVTCGCSELDERYDGKGVLLAGMITSVRTINTKKGDQMAFVQIEDMGGQCEVVVFPRTYAEVKELLIPDSVVMVKGKAQAREGQTSLLADSFQTYVDMAIAIGPEPEYQKPLLDIIPTINGFNLEGSSMDENNDASNGFSSGMNGFEGDDDNGFFQEESPFANDPPAWLKAEVATENASQGASSLKSDAPAASYTTKPSEEAAPDNPYLHESRNLREEDGNFEIPLPKSLQNNAALLAEVENENEPDKPSEQAAPDNPYLHESRNLREEDGDFVIALPKSLQNDPSLRAELEAPGQADGVAKGEVEPDAQLSSTNPGTNPGEEHPKGQPEEYSNGLDHDARNGNGHQNGHKSGQSNGHSNGLSESQNGQNSLIANGKRTMQIVFRPSGDLDRDKYRLKQIVETVRNPKGRDQFLITIKSNGKPTTLAFPDDPCSINDRLCQELTKFFRVEVQVKG
jgi:DNA polymerase III subunit alpha